VRVTTPAWVLRRVRWSDSSLILNLYTLDFGRMSVMAKGALRPGGRFHGSLELFSGISASISRREGRELETLMDVSVEEPGAGLRSDPEAFAHACLFSEWVMGLNYGSEPSQPAFHLIAGVFRRLGEQSVRWGVTCAGIEKLLRLSGLRLETEKCTRCGLPASEGTAWSHSAGGIVCRECACPGDAAATAGVLEFIRSAQRAGIEASGRTRLWKGGFRQCHDFMRDFAEAHLQARIRLRSLAVLEELENAVR
jgi:DNA repair protein RecO (recombination protein O)